MADDVDPQGFQLSACRELLDAHPESPRIREQAEALEEAMPDRPGVMVSFCRTIIETTCKTILMERFSAFGFYELHATNAHKSLEGIT